MAGNLPLPILPSQRYVTVRPDPSAARSKLVALTRKAHHATVLRRGGFPDGS